MKTLALLATSAAAIVIAWFAADDPTVPTGVAFGEVLQRMHAADTLLLKVTRNGASADVTIRQPGMLRWEDGSGRYQIARGSRLWQVDANADATAQQNPWFGSDGSVDLLALASVRPDDSASLLAAQPTSRGDYAGKPCFVYRRSVTSDGRALRLEAFVDAQTKQLVGLIARDPQARLTAPPLAELTLIALNPEVDESKFRVPVKLAETDRIGKLTDLQGIVALRAVGARRWTPLCREVLVQPGDWIRTDVRGANAATVDLVSQQRLIVGPGSLVEVISPDEVRLHAGSIAVTRTEQTPNDLVLRGIGDAAITLQTPGQTIYELTRAEALVAVPGKPSWLQGYDGTSAEDSIGSLIVNIDGRDVPLTVGEHHVSVEIRDQIARTTIEETFVNNTKGRLEGTFHFPLPQDASISGFGMWIGNELVEADIVEKQRAREIYETILREKRDPGLLEWTGGNIFKARVFPIEAHSEKRVKIVYTQVLPLRGNRFRYSYGLRSEMLTLHPLRELNVKVLVSSAVPLASVESPTHTCRTQLTPHAAELEFTAQDYSPTKDLEVVCQVDHRENDVVVIPHLRGNVAQVSRPARAENAPGTLGREAGSGRSGDLPHGDGYFLLQLMPPGGPAEGNWQRELLPDGEPLELILLCDTSGSMDSTMRRTQAEFVTAVLASLGDRDRFNLAMCDVGTAWTFNDFVASTDDTIAQVRQSLGERVSLGWTDLDQAFAAVLEKATPRTHVLYIGDGIVATSESDPAAFVTRLHSLVQSRDRKGATSPAPPTQSRDREGATSPVPPASQTPNRAQSGNQDNTSDAALVNALPYGRGSDGPTFHSISVGSAYESVVLKGIAALGGGSTRQISGEVTPQQMALELLNEIAQPGLKDVQVEFRGVRVAAVYPESLPNIPAGTQQILVGRYLPEGRDQSGEVVVTGRRNGEMVKFVARIELKDAEAGNSFIPRLWARARLDQLLQQGPSPQIQQEVIGLSEEFHIITPYTSLLVLESDADRERFGVQRRFEMRDGEQFFAAGRDNANYVLRQQQMQKAGNWRLGLRRQLIVELARLGRDAGVFAAPQEHDYRFYVSTGEALNRPLSLSFGGGVGGATEWDFRSAGGRLSELRANQLGQSLLGRFERERGVDKLFALGDELADVDLALRVDSLSAADDFGMPMPAEPALFDTDFDGVTPAIQLGFEDELLAKEQVEFGVDRKQLADRRGGVNRGLMPALETVAGRFRYMEAAKDKQAYIGQPVLAGWAGVALQSHEYAGRSFYFDQGRHGGQLAWVDALFPVLAESVEQKETKVTKGAGWNAEAVELSRSLLRAEALRSMEGGVELRRTTQAWHHGWDRLVPGGARLELWSPSAWLTRDHGQGAQPIVNWCDAESRGVYSEAFLLGRRRAATEVDRSELPFQLGDHSLTPLHESFHAYTAAIDRSQADRAVLTLTLPDQPDLAVRFTIDTVQNALLRYEHLSKGVATHATDFSDFVEVAGCWWATMIVHTDGQSSHPSSVTTQTVAALSPEQVTESFDVELARRAAVQVLTVPSPELRVAKQAAADGTADLDDRFTLLQYYAATQRWEQVFEQLRALETLAVDKSGMPWVRAAVEVMAGRREDARQTLTKLSPGVAMLSTPAAPAAGVLVNPEADLFLAEYLLGQAYPITQWNEYAPLVTELRPIYERQPDREVAFMEWREQQLSVLNALGPADAALAWAKEIAAAMPGDPQQQIAYAQRLVNLNRDDEAIAFLREQLDQPNHWDSGERESLRENYADRLENRGRWPDLLAFLREWLATEPSSSSPYARFLSALVMTDDVAAVDATVREWLALAVLEGDLPLPQSSRLEAAIQFCLGNGHHLYRYNGMDPKWRQPLLELAQVCIAREDRHQYAQSFIDNGRFDQTDEGDRLRGDLLGWLLDGASTLSIQRLQDQLNWLGRGRLLVGQVSRPARPEETLQIRQVTDAEWAELANIVLTRWTAETNADQRHRLGQILLGLYAGHLTDRRVPFARRLITDGPEKYRSSYRADLFNLLLEQPWTDAIEAEALLLWPTITDAEQKFDRLMVQIPALYRFVDVMIAGRIAAAQQAQRDAGNTDELTRTQLAAQQKEFTTLARTGVAERLASAQNPGFFNETGFLFADDLQPWLAIEQTYLDVLLDRHSDDVLAQCWALLGDAPPRFNPEQQVDPQPEITAEQLGDELLQTLLRQRAWVTVLNLAARKNADEALIARVLAYVDAGITATRTLEASGSLAGDADNLKSRISSLQAAWKATKYDLLILLDRPDELATALREWIAADDWDIPWRLALGRLEAERGRLQEAIELFESVRKDDELSPADQQSLADWYLVEDRRSDYDRNRVEAFKAMEEWQLANWLRQQANALSSGSHELDDETLFAVAALFEKTSSPGGHYWVLRELYQATQDFQLLAHVPETILGRTRQQAYDALQQLHGTILQEIRKEATADELLAQLRQRRADIDAGVVPRGADPNTRSQTLDLRTLDLLEAMVERRAAEVLNQPGPHVQAALAALKRAFDREWQEGERLQMAMLLQNLGHIAVSELAAEQARELRQLYDGSPAGTIDRARIGHAYAYVLFHYHSRRDEALAFDEAALRELAAAHAGRIPEAAADLVTGYSSLLQATGAYLQAEQFVLKQLSSSTADGERLTYEEHLNELYKAALYADGRTLLGTGEPLYRNLVQRLIDQSATADMNRQYYRVSMLLQVYDHGCTQKFATAAVDLQAFANDTLPGLIHGQDSLYANLVNQTADTIGRQLGHIEALALLLTRVEQYPPRFDYEYRSAWSQHGSRLAEYRHEAAGVAGGNRLRAERLSALEERLLAVVLTELRRDLSSGESRDVGIYTLGHSYFWEAKKADFIRTANEVLAERRDAPRTHTYVAMYLHDRIHEFDRGIEVLFAAHRRGLLDDAGVDQLIDYLHRSRRYAESVALLEAAMDRQPDRMDLRTRLMEAYHATSRPQQLAELVAATDAHFHQQGRWTEDAMYGFARGCATVNEHTRAAGYFEEAINLRQRTAPNRGIGDGTLSGYYKRLAEVYSQLGQTKQAVDAAAGAIVCWGTDPSNRQQAFNALRDVLVAAADLDAYVGSVDAEANSSGADSPVIRKALGLAYQAKSEWAKAVTQLQQSLELQPGDREVHAALLACYDALGDQAGATRQLLAQIDVDRHNLELYTDLARRAAENEALAERAATAIVESAPNEAEPHQALARFRQDQNRWDEAVVHWRRVAELRKLEPTGLLGLAGAQAHQQHWEPLRDTLQQLRRRDWPAHFGDVEQQVQSIEQQIPRD